MAVVVPGQIRGQQLDRHRALETRISGLKDDAHAALAELGHGLIGAKPSAGDQVHQRGQYIAARRETGRKQRPQNCGMTWRSSVIGILLTTPPLCTAVNGSIWDGRVTRCDSHK